MQFIQKHRRVISFILVFVFAIFCVTDFISVPANAMIGTATLLTYALVSTLLISGGMTFASTQDIDISVQGFIDKMAEKQDTQAAMNQIALLATSQYCANGLIDLNKAKMQMGEDWLIGWSYFWENASDYFGLETGVTPLIPDTNNYYNSNGNIISCLTPVTLLYGANPTYGEVLYMYNKTLPIGAILLSDLSVGSSYYTAVPYIVDCSGSSPLFFSFKLYYSGSQYGLFIEKSIDGINYTSVSTLSFLDINSNDFITVAHSVIDGISYFLPFKSSYYDSSSNGVVVGKINSATSCLPWTSWGDYTGAGSICPDIDYPEDNLYTGQDVFGAMDKVLDADYTPVADVVIDINDVLGRLETGIGKDILTGDLTQSDVIPDVITDELDKVNPSSSPSPSPSTSPSPSPAPSTPPGNLPLAPPLLTKKFPFSLPWDIVALVEKMSADPVPPKFEIPLNFGFIGVNEVWIFDMEDFEEVVIALRWGLSILFVLGLIFITKKIVR